MKLNANLGENRVCKIRPLYLLLQSRPSERQQFHFFLSSNFITYTSQHTLVLQHLHSREHIYFYMRVNIYSAQRSKVLSLLYIVQQKQYTKTRYHCMVPAKGSDNYRVYTLLKYSYSLIHLEHYTSERDIFPQG